MKKDKIYKVFISYSWTPPENKERTIELGSRLIEDGIEVVIDVWDLKEGQDKYKFMEKMVNSSDIDRVLIICNKDYMDKANDRKGGVGSESMIISEEIYSNAEQTKFIPVIFEKDTENKPYIPTYTSSRIYIDLSDEEYFEEEYEKLLRNVYSKPIHDKPKLGKPPAYLFDNKSPSIFNNRLNAIKSALIKESKYSPELIQDFFTIVIEELASFKIDLSDLDKEIDEEVLQKISDLKYCTEALVVLVKLLIRYSKENILLFHKFFEKLLEFVASVEEPNTPSGTLGSMKNDQFYYIMYEFFAFISGILLEKELFDEISYLLHTPYVVYNENTREFLNLKFVNFNTNPSSLNHHRIKRLAQNNINEVSQVIRERSKTIFQRENYISEIDAILYYVSCLTAEKGQYSRIWFPHTCDTSYNTIISLKKLKSLLHFDKFKILLKVNNKEELSVRIKYVLDNKIDKVERYYYGLEYIHVAFNLDEIGIEP